MSETQLNGVNFDQLKSVNNSPKKLKTFTVVGKELTEKQRKAGYYLSIMKGDKVDGIFNGLVTETDRDGNPNTEVEVLGADGSIIRISAFSGLKRLLSSVEMGTPVRIIYNGKDKITKGELKGKSFHNWDVLA